MRKYWYILKTHLSVSLEYRGALLIWTLVELISLTSAVFVWSAVFKSNSNVGNYDYTKIVSYYLLIPIVGGFTSIYISEHLPKRIKNGEISADLMKPFDISIASLLDQLSFKLTQLTIKFPIYLIVALIFIFVFEINFSLLNLSLAFVVCIFSYLLNYTIDVLISYFAFWFDEVWSLSHIKNVLLMVLGGLTFPLDLLPSKLQILFNFLPFRFIYYFPVKVAQGLVPLDIFISQFLQLIMWILLLLSIGRVVWNSGLKKYGAYGN